ncbi:MAG: hypothetical protein H7Y08_07525 [Rhizobiaceae bacterium]|nr:hypothetical protein [Rhizobiaceae bacterium]
MAEIDRAESSVHTGTTQAPLDGPLSPARPEGPLVPAYGADNSIHSAAVDGLTASSPADVPQALEADGKTIIGDERALDLPEAAHGTFGFPVPATGLGESDAAVLTRRLAAAGFGDQDMMLPPSAERAGVIASFVLNAAMIPGWPPPRPIEGAPLRDFVATFPNAKTLSKSDLELLLYLAGLGFSRAHIARLLKALDDRKRRSRIMKAIAVIMTNVGALLEAFRQEIERRQEEAAEELRLKTPGGRAKIGV